MNNSADLLLLAWTTGAVVLLVVLVAWAKLNAFIALLVVSVGLGWAAGLGTADVARAFQDGVGGTLGFVAIVIGLGTIAGRLLAASGGGGVVATRLLSVFGSRRAVWAVAFTAFLVGLPVFFTVGLVLLAPIVFSLVRRAGVPLLLLALPLVAGLSISHALVPPHPGPLAAIERLQADTGRVLYYSLIVGLPVAMIVGPLAGLLAGRLVRVEPGGLSADLGEAGRPPRGEPGFWTAIVVMLLPIALMLAATIAAAWLPAEHGVRRAAELAGTPLLAMLAAAIAAIFLLGRARGFTPNQILHMSEECLAPIGSILLVVGAGGGFGRLLTEAGVADAIARYATGFELSPLLLGWTVAALLRVSVGSATVAITTAASIVGPVAAATPGTNPELLVLALGAGSIVASHVNDGGFWLVKEYFNLTVPQTLGTWTVLETVLSIAALLAVLVLDAVGA